MGLFSLKDTTHTFLTLKKVLALLQDGLFNTQAIEGKMWPIHIFTTLDDKAIPGERVDIHLEGILGHHFIGTQEATTEYVVQI